MTPGSLAENIIPCSQPGVRRARTPGVRLVRKHHLLVRVSHWLNVLLLAGLIVSGISIYWASPIYQHAPDPQTGNSDYFADPGVWLCAHVLGLHSYASPPDWFYDHFSLGPYMLAPALRLHWCCAYLFILNGLVYLAGLCLGGEWRSLLPRASDGRGALLMAKYYLGAPFALLRRRRRVPPRFQLQIQPAPATRVFFDSHRRFPVCCHRLGDSQTRTAFLGCIALRWIRPDSGLAFLADVPFHRVCRTPRLSGFRRRLGHAAQHDHRMVRQMEDGRASS